MRSLCVRVHPIIVIVTAEPGGPVCAENFIRIDLVTESLNVSADGRAAMLFPHAVDLAVQVEEPT